jgi:parallel beta-helix repeat protein
MIQGRKELVAGILACAIAGQEGAAQGRSGRAGAGGLGMEVLEGRLNLSSLSGSISGTGVAPGVQAGAPQVGAGKALSLSAALGESGTDTGAFELPLRRERPTRALRQGEKLLPIAIIDPNPTPLPPVAPAVPTTPVTPAIPATDPLAALRAQLHGDGKQDDSATIQKMVDVAYAQGLHAITLPEGVFALNKTIWFYGSSVTLSGQGTKSILQVVNHQDGLGGYGWALKISSQFDPSLYMATQAVTGDTITLRGNVNIQAGEMLFLTNGRGSMKLVEQRHGGTLVGDGQFNELAPDEFVQVASVSVNGAGNTVIKLTKSVVGKDDYFNVAGGNVVDDHYLHVSRLSKPADHLTVSDLAIRFSDPYADASLFTFYTTYTTVKNVTLLDSAVLHTNPAMGAFWSEGSQWTTFDHLTTPGAIELNSCRFAVITNNTAGWVAMEEATTDTLVSHNTLTTTTGVSLRTNDMGCQRIEFSYNTLHGGSKDTGAIGIWEGEDIRIIGNVVKGGTASIWLNRTRGCTVTGNTADEFNNWVPLGIVALQSNSWQ